MITLDPLALSADPRLYVPLDTGERALARIAASLADGRSPILLAGPGGIGKTLLLSVLAERARSSYPRVRLALSLCLEPDDLTDWLRHKLFGRSSTNRFQAEAELLEDLRAIQSEPVLLLVDEIHRTPEASVRKLAELARSIPQLVVVVAGSTGRELDTRVPILAPGFVALLPDALPEAEILELYDRILAHPGLSLRLQRRLANTDRAVIVRASAGSPRLLKNDLARRNLEQRPPARPAPPAAQVRTLVQRVAAAPTATPVARARPEPERTPHAQVVRNRATRASIRVARESARRVLRGIGGAPWSLAHVSLALFVAFARALEAAAAACVRPIAAAARSAHFLLTRTPRVIGAAARRAVGFAIDGFAAFAYAVQGAAAACVRPIAAAARSAHFHLTRTPLVIGAAARHAVRVVIDCFVASARALQGAVAACVRPSATAARRTAAAVHSASEIGWSVARDASRRIRVSFVEGARSGTARARSGIGAALRHVALVVQRESTDAARVVRNVAGRARRRIDDASIGAAAASATRLLRARILTMRARARILAPVRGSAARGTAVLARAGRAILRIAPTAAMPATALLAVALFSGVAYETKLQAGPATVLAATDGSAPLAVPVNVQVNARPWARVRIDGVDVGPTPLSHPLAPGIYEFEAEFPDGRRIQRKIDIGQERRFVSLQ